MKTTNKLAIAALLLSSSFAFGQINFDRDLQQFRQPDKRGVNQFEALDDNGVPFDGVKVRVGGAFALQFQGLEHTTGMPDTALTEIGKNFNLPTANLDLDVALAEGVRMHLRTYLSSRHHNEAWVKGGYIQVSSLDFIREGLLENLMDITTVKIGLMEVNYGDYHFRRTDNARAIYNPFVGNLILDAFTTEMGGELYFHPGDFLIMAGVTNGNLNQNVVGAVDQTPAFLAKLGYDSQLTDDFRFRLTTSMYHTGDGQRNTLYGGDRAGSRFYGVMDAGDFAGRFNPGFNNEVTAIMVNPFIKWKGLELLGTLEMTKGKAAAEMNERKWMQYAGDLLYRFGTEERFYVGAKYNLASGEIAGGSEVSIDRIEAGAGWYLTNNIMVKAEYLIQNYNDFAPTSLLHQGKFNGVMLEAVVSF